jgi:hypothetical protein
VLVTDGQIGNEDQILRHLGPWVEGLRIFTLGIDQAVNAAFLKRLAALGGGSCELVESEDRLDEVMARIHRHIGPPVLTGLHIEPAGMELDRSTLVPGRLPDLTASMPLFILGRYHGAASGALVVQAQDEAGRPWLQKVAGTVCADSALTSVWARGWVRELEDHYAAGRGKRNDLMRQIIETSLRFGVLCRFTAFVAVDVKEVVNPGGQMQRVTQPVESAAGWAMLGTDQAEAVPGKARGRNALPSQPACAPPVQAPEALRRLRQEVEKQAPPGPDMVTMGKLGHTPGAKKAIELAIEEARNLGQNEVGAEHLLLGLLREQAGVTAGVLSTLGVGVDDVRQEIVQRLAQTAGAASSPSRPKSMAARVLAGMVHPPAPFNEQVRRVMQLANQEAQRLNHEYIGTEHILLGLSAEGSGIVADILNRPDRRPASHGPRVLDLLAQLRRVEGASAAERLGALGVLAEQLAVLLEELRLMSAGQQIRPLEELLAELRGLLARTDLAEAEIAEMWTRVERVLEAFGGGTAGAKGARRDDFWK